jgi:glycerol-3-phosphate O-acyltransferase/dihydroxyacetone phosphate acyltransferase
VTPAEGAGGLRDADAGGPGYVLVRALSRFLLRLFYARIEVVGAENVPAHGALIVAANHHNSIVDAMLLLAMIPRHVRVLANAPLFRHFLIGPFLRAVGALPVHRRQEAGSEAPRNEALFEATTAALATGGAIAIFPEGRTQPEPSLQELRTGTARMLLAAETGSPNLSVTLLPVGLVFDRPGTFRTGRALVWIGPPVRTATRDPAEGAAAARALTDRLGAALRAQIVEADDRQTLRLLRLVEELWNTSDGDGVVAVADDRHNQPRTAAGATGEAARAAWLQGAMQTYRSLARIAPERVAAFRRDLEAYDDEARRAGVAAEQLSRSYSVSSVARFTLREGASLLLGAPLALCGMILHGLPYLLTILAVRLIPHTDEEEATDKIAAGLVLYPLAWLGEAWAVHRLGGGRALAVFLVALFPAGFFALAWHERLGRVGREARAFTRFLGDRGSPSRLRARRVALVTELRALVAIADARGEERTE